MKTIRDGRGCLTQAVLDERARRADRVAFDAVMARAGGTPPREGDEIEAADGSDWSRSIDVSEAQGGDGI